MYGVLAVSSGTDTYPVESAPRGLGDWEPFQELEAPRTAPPPETGVCALYM